MFVRLVAPNKVACVDRRTLSLSVCGQLSQFWLFYFRRTDSEKEREKATIASNGLFIAQYKRGQEALCTLQ